MIHHRAENAQHSVYSSLKNGILGLRLVPGTVISEKDLSLRFRVSRTPVREAFIALSKESLVTVMPQKGSMVSKIDLTRVGQELFLRESLEKAALRLFLKDYKPFQLAEMEKYIELQAETAGTKKYEQFLQYDNMFHRIFFGDQNVAWEAIENMCGHYYRFRLLTIWLQDIVKDIVEEHKQIFQAVKRRDSEETIALLESHLHKLKIEEAMVKRLFPDYFADSAETAIMVDFGGLSMSKIKPHLGFAK
jgi:DNA-binding GntR family transcriptional regulator